ncbi:uncharacterized protein LTR77_005353 [Saxophila tyrrhenica]|uniref:CFEM domain-containing protein n=1 Tax=Saxophila tyrrhenica TaxID=1690608 RepID=A0AAV9P8P0_9PEZI|nr:hypothetical protein LTR77_005353 [Saxophila tyrrhenica]
MPSLLKPTIALVAVAMTVVPGMKTIAKAQDLKGLPSCASPALFSAIEASGCGFSEIKCICSHKDTIFPAVASAIKDACDPADEAAIQALASTYCGTTSIATSAAPTATLKPTATSESGSATAVSAITTSMVAGSPLTTDTSTTSSTTYHKTMTYSTTSTTMPTETGGAAEVGMSAGALAVVLAGLSWAFAEL